MKGLELFQLSLLCHLRTTMALGKGQFGDVEIGIWTYNGRIKEVAVKTLNLSSTKLEDKIKFLQEAAIMAQFKHPNVIQLYGIVTDGEPVGAWWESFCIIFYLLHTPKCRLYLCWS